MSYFNFMFIIMFLSSFILVLGGDNWFMLWMGLEINMISFIMLIYSKDIFSVEMCMKYFFIQGVGSSLLLMMIILSGDYFKESILLILSYKMGSGPFFFWFPVFCSGIDWKSCILVMSMQKLIPLMFFTMFMCSIAWVILVASMVIGVLGCFNESKLKKFMGYSSIHYVGWMILCINTESFLWIFYMLCYTFMLLGVVVSINSFEMFKVKDFLLVKKPLLYLFSMLNMGGMPPMLGFFLKWWVFLLLVNKVVWVVWLIIVMAVFMFYVYLRLVYHLMVDYSFFHSFSFSGLSKSMNNKLEWVYMLAMGVAPMVGWLIL
uniref:NADH-ubiquinone oxidoreductase chain 2 n=1 Tax=Tetragnatha macilenta TaxID=545211 RepID=A0A343S593_9ARAC|nr:NADH dehydrogenase subunit 2 [Tetragnatha macilenta]